MGFSRTDNTAQSGRQTLTDLLRVRTAFIVDPVATLLARSGVSPNSLTVLGMVAHLLPAWLITQGHMALAAVAIFFIAPLDAFDGALARKLGASRNNFGAFLDSTLDRVAEIILFTGFIFYFGQRENTIMLVTSYIAITGSLMVSYTRARAEALGVSGKIGLLSRVERYAVLVLFLLINYPHVGIIIVAIFSYITVAQRTFHVWQQIETESG